MLVVDTNFIVTLSLHVLLSSTFALYIDVNLARDYRLRLRLFWLGGETAASFVCRRCFALVLQLLALDGFFGRR